MYRALGDSGVRGTLEHVMEFVFVVCGFLSGIRVMRVPRPKRSARRPQPVLHSPQLHTRAVLLDSSRMYAKVLRIVAASLPIIVIPTTMMLVMLMTPMM